VNITQRNEETDNAKRDREFSVMTYNVLAESYTIPSRYHYCPEFARRFNYRGKRIVSEISEYNPDIVCLQEVDHFSDFFKPQLESLGYKGVFVKRTGWKLDGCALFYKQGRLTMTEYAPVEFNDVSKINFHFRKDNVAIVAAFSLNGGGAAAGDDAAEPIKLSKHSKPSTKPGSKLRADLVVSTTHFYWDPAYEDVKNAQAKMLLNSVRMFADSIPVVVCGDFNSNSSSDVYKLFKNDSLGMESIYSHFNEPQTHFTPSYYGCIDYIFYSKHLKPTHILEPLEEHLITEKKACLSDIFPSDHVPLMGTFSFIDNFLFISSRFPSSFPCLCGL